jgi:hypothetical protein
VHRLRFITTASETKARALSRVFNTLRLGPGLLDPITERRAPQAIPAMNLVADKAYTTGNGRLSIVFENKRGTCVWKPLDMGLGNRFRRRVMSEPIAPAAGAIGPPCVGNGADVQRLMQYTTPPAQKPVSGVEERGRLICEYAAGVSNLQ